MKALLVIALFYTAASLLHFTHNAEFLADYPNLPASFTRVGVYGAWLAVTAIGALGYAMLRIGWKVAGLLLLAAYAAFGLDGLAHYSLAPFSAHTGMMNFTILFEVAMALLLLGVVGRGLVAINRERHS
ncbi:MAG: hypothetical protein ABIX37_06670 [Gammaproteobacteria bacterium]